MRLRHLVPHLFTIAALTLLPTAASAQNPTPQQIASLPACTAAQLTLRTDPRGGDLDGMSHSGTYLLLRNRGSQPCKLTPIPQITLANAQGPLAITEQVKGARFLHPGPVVLPIALQPGQELAASLYWTSGPVFDHPICVDPTTVTLKLDAAASISTPIAGHLCGEQARGIVVEVSRFQPATGKPTS